MGGFPRGGSSPLRRIRETPAIRGGFCDSASRCVAHRAQPTTGHPRIHPTNDGPCCDPKHRMGALKGLRRDGGLAPASPSQNRPAEYRGIVRAVGGAFVSCPSAPRLGPAQSAAAHGRQRYRASADFVAAEAMLPRSPTAPTATALTQRVWLPFGFILAGPRLLRRPRCVRKPPRLRLLPRASRRERGHRWHPACTLRPPSRAAIHEPPRISPSPRIMPAPSGSPSSATPKMTAQPGAM